jgi:hypothetical protein
MEDGTQLPAKDQFTENINKKALFLKSLGLFVHEADNK